MWGQTDPGSNSTSASQFYLIWIDHVTTEPVSSAGVPILHIRHFASKIALLRVQKLNDFWTEFQTVFIPLPE